MRGIARSVIRSGSAVLVLWGVISIPPVLASGQDDEAGEIPNVQPVDAPARENPADEARRKFYLESVLGGEPGNVRCLLVDGEGTLWFGAQAGLFSVRAGKAVRAAGENRGGMITAILEAGGTVWAGGEKGMFRLDGDRMVRLPGESPRAVQVLGAHDDRVWVGARNGLFRIDRSDRRGNEPPSRDGPERSAAAVIRVEAGPRNVLSMVADDDAIWLGAKDLFAYSGGSLRRVEGVRGGWIRAILRSGDDLWVGTDERLLRLRDGDLSPVEGDWVGRVYALAGGPDGAIWVGSFNGLFRADDRGVESVGDGAIKGVMALMQEGDSLLLGALGGLYRTDGSEATRLGGDEIGWVGSLLSDGRGGVWIGAENGLFRLRGDEITRVGILRARMGPSTPGHPESTSDRAAREPAPPTD